MAAPIRRRRQAGEPGTGVRALVAACAIALCAALSAAPAIAGPTGWKRVRTGGKIVPIPKDIPHARGAMIDRRLIPNLRYMSQRFGFYITEGYAGPWGNRVVGCPRCHVSNSEHKIGLAVDIWPAGRFTTRCDRRWAAVTRLALWAEPRQYRPAYPFRWVGYDGDYYHGCGHHLHLSWTHAETRNYRIARWVDVFTNRPGDIPEPPPPSGGTGPDELSGADY